MKIQVGINTAKSDDFVTEVKQWVFQEQVDGRNLTDIINTEHENVKYLPGYKLPTNVRAIPDAVEVVKDCDIIVIVLPHQFLPRLLESIKADVKSTAVVVSLIKGQLDIAIPSGENENPRIQLGSELISSALNVPCGVLMGANVASNVAAQEFTESTLAIPERDHAKIGERLLEATRAVFDLPTFPIQLIGDLPTAEICGGLKNVVALGAG